MIIDIFGCVIIGIVIGLFWNSRRHRPHSSFWAGYYNGFTLRFLWDAEGMKDEARDRLHARVEKETRIILEHPELTLGVLGREAYRQMPWEARRLRKKYPRGIDHCAHFPESLKRRGKR